MIKYVQISFALLYLFLINGNSFLYAHTNQANETISLEKVVRSSLNQNLEVSTDFNVKLSIPTLQADSFPTGKKKSKRFKFSFLEKEEKEKEEKFTSFEKCSKGSFYFPALLEISSFTRFYNYGRNYLHISDNLNYFLFHKCYILFQVFRL
jgi:hypothetical protein